MIFNIETNVTFRLSNEFHGSMKRTPAQKVTLYSCIVAPRKGSGQPHGMGAHLYLDVLPPDRSVPGFVFYSFTLYVSSTLRTFIALSCHNLSWQIEFPIFMHVFFANRSAIHATTFVQYP